MKDVLEDETSNERTGQISFRTLCNVYEIIF